jgi:hypothetical protein
MASTTVTAADAVISSINCGVDVLCVRAVEPDLRARYGVTVQYAGRKRLGLRQDRGQAWRRRCDYDGLLR